MILKLSTAIVVTLVLTLPKTADTFIKNDYKFDVSNTKTVRELVEQIRNPEAYSKTHFIMKPCDVATKQNSILIATVNQTYGGNLLNFATIMNFTHHATVPSCKFQRYAALFEVMKDSNHVRTKEMMLLINYVKLAMSDDETKKDKELMSGYERLMSAFPSDMRAIIFGDLVHIKNRGYNEYLYETVLEEDHHRMILTWKPGNVPEQSYFYFEAFLTNGRLHFSIKNDRYYTGAPMCLSSKYYNADRRKTVTCPGQSSILWTWYVDPYENFFTIRSTYTLNYLFASGAMYDAERRWTFTWNGNPNDDRNNPIHQWTIINA